MDIVLLKTVPQLGRAGETKHVAVGYAKNFLLARGLAVLPSDPRAKQVHVELAKQEASKQQEKSKLTAKVNEWAGKTVNLSGKASADGTLYAAITHRDVAKQLGVDAAHVTFDPVKHSGTYTATIDLGSGTQATVVVVVTTQS